MKPVLVPLATTLAMQALVSLAALTVPVLAPEAPDELSIPATLVGAFVALIYLGAMMSSLASGDLVGRFGAIRVSQVGLMLCAAGLALTAAGVVPLMVASALLIGAGYGPGTPASSQILARTTPSHLMGFMFSLKQTGVPLGGALAGALVPAFVVLWGWRGAAIAVSVACVLMAFLAQATRAGFDDDRDPARRVSAASVLRPLGLVFAHPRIRDLAICTFFFSATQLCLATDLVTYLTTDIRMPLVTAGLVLALAQGAGIGGRLLWGVAADRWVAPRRLLGMLAIAMGASSLLTTAFAPGWPVIAVILVSMVFGATAIGWNGVYLAEVARLAPAGMAGALTGGTLFFTFFGVVVGPPAFGALVAATDSFTTGFAVLGVVIMAVGLMLMLTRAT
jgi:MFS family permease